MGGWETGAGGAGWEKGREMGAGGAGWEKGWDMGAGGAGACLFIILQINPPNT